MTTPDLGTTNSTSYTTTLSGTPGTNPSVTVNIPGTTALVIITANVATTSPNGSAYMSFGVSSGQAPSDATALIRSNGGTGSMQSSAVFFIQGLTTGNHTFTLYYRAGLGDSCVFSNRTIVVMPF